MAIDDAHISPIADKMRDLLGVIAEPRVVAPLDLDVALERRKAANATFSALGHIEFAHADLLAMYRVLSLRTWRSISNASVPRIEPYFEPWRDTTKWRSPR
jgi:hypothetical protein